MAGLTETKTKPNPKLKLELKFGAELCNIFNELRKQAGAELGQAQPELGHEIRF